MSQTTPGLVHVYTGDGKGKTSAALGMALRAAGHGWRTYIGQFMKGQDYGELEAARMLGSDAHGCPLLTVEQFGKPTFIHVNTATLEDTRIAQEGLASALQAMQSGKYQIVVLDEINVALYFKLLTVQDVLDFVDAKPDDVELVLTGRRVPDEILGRADYVTVMQEVKHPYQRGIRARKGIEF
ncbi:MAG: cob(I)yrinic acid a,c-diamide adenosyltransferase [Anaerolineales bacterium]|nr:MAG: cob(I)yrinic acid a,c-diamide adenosyltransferase [Anaerolineales bacterium]